MLKEKDGKLARERGAGLGDLRTLQLHHHARRGLEFSQICLSCRKTEVPIKYSTLHTGRKRSRLPLKDVWAKKPRSSQAFGVCVCYTRKTGTMVSRRCHITAEPYKRVGLFREGLAAAAASTLKKAKLGKKKNITSSSPSLGQRSLEKNTTQPRTETAQVVNNSPELVNCRCLHFCMLISVETRRY